MPALHIDRFGDPHCPWDFSAEPRRQRLRWLYGDGLRWTPHMIVLAETDAEYEAKGFTAEVLEHGLAVLQDRYGMPIEPEGRGPATASIGLCRAVVAVREHAPDHAEALLRALRVAYMAGRAGDDDATVADAARGVGLEPGEVADWTADPAVEAALRADMAAARRPGPAALALDFRLADAGPDGGRRYTCPTLVLSAEDGRSIEAPGFQPVEAYEVAIANLAPDLERRPDPTSVREVLEWADGPLATMEVAAVRNLDVEATRRELADTATFTAVGRDGYWSLAAA